MNLLNLSVTQDAALFTFSHFPAVSASENVELQGKAIGMEVMKVLGYIPLVGCIVAIARLIFAVNEFKANKYDEERASAFKTMFSLRAAAEFLCLGPLLVISDIIVTLWMKNKIDQAQNDFSNVAWFPPETDEAYTPPPETDEAYTPPPETDEAYTLPPKTDEAYTLPPKTDEAYTLPPETDEAYSTYDE